MVAENGNGKNGNYTAQQFIDAIQGSGGIVSAIAAKVGCAWNTAKKYIDNYATVQVAWQNERNRITDKAQHHIINAIEKGDLSLCKWWVTVMDEEFRPPVQRSEVKAEHSGEIKTGVDSDQHLRTLSTLAETLGGILLGQGDKGDSDVGPAE